MRTRQVVLPGSCNRSGVVGPSGHRQPSLPMLYVIVGALAAGASAAPPPTTDANSRGQETGAVRTEAAPLVTGSPVHLQSVVAGIPPTPVGDPSGVDKNRYLSLSVPATGATALRVTLVDLHNPNPSNAPCCPPPDFSTFEAATCTAAGEANGCSRWVGEPRVYLEGIDSPSAGNFVGARLQCTPSYQDFSSMGLIHVTGAETVPSSSYDVQTFGVSCMGVESGCTDVSTPLRINTTRRGDIFPPFQAPSPARLTQPDGLDLAVIFNKFRLRPGAPIKPVAQLQANFAEPNFDVNALDVVNCVDGFKGFAYPYSGPCVCPSVVPCNVTSCSTPSQCTGPYGAGAVCVKTCASGPVTGQPCIVNVSCGACDASSAIPGLPCDANGDCPGGTCDLGTCGSGFCRDRCGRCN